MEKNLINEDEKDEWLNYKLQIKNMTRKFIEKYKWQNTKE